MSRISTIKTAATTLAVAMGVGFVMQLSAGDGTAGRAEPAADHSAVRTLMMSTNAQGEAVFGVPDVVTTPLPHVENVRKVLAVDVVYTEFAVPAMGTILATPIEGCAATLVGTPEAAAMVSLSLTAPCAQNEDFMLRHETFEISARTDDEGNATLTVPALVPLATYAVLFDNVEHVRTQVDVPDVALFDRAVLQWGGQFNLQLHALEAGASIGDPNHVWSASVHSPDDAIAGIHGFVVRLGTINADIPRLAEVYTYPTGYRDEQTDIVLQIGVAVTEANCGREVDTVIIQSNTGQSIVTEKMGAALPGCGFVGELAMLPGKFQDATLASH